MGMVIFYLVSKMNEVNYMKKSLKQRTKEWANDTSIQDFMNEHNVSYMEARETLTGRHQQKFINQIEVK